MFCLLHGVWSSLQKFKCNYIFQESSAKNSICSLDYLSIHPGIDGQPDEMTFAEAFSALRDYAPPSTSLSHQNEANSENNLGKTARL